MKEHWIDRIFDDPLWLTVGVIFIYFGSKAFLETINNRKTIKDWGRSNWVQMPVALLVGVILISKDDEIAEAYFGADENGGKVFAWWIYTTVPILLNVIYEIIKVLPKISASIVHLLQKKIGLSQDDAKISSKTSSK